MRCSWPRSSSWMPSGEFPPLPPPRHSKTNDLSTRRCRRHQGSAGPSPCRASTPRRDGRSRAAAGVEISRNQGGRTDGSRDGGKMIRGAAVAGDRGAGARRIRGPGGAGGSGGATTRATRTLRAGISSRDIAIVRKVGMRQSVGERGCNRRSCHRRAGGLAGGRMTIVCMKKEELVGGIFGNLFRRRRR